jgi:hypothetical protein
LQFAHVAGAAHVGQALEGFGDFDRFGELGIEGVDGEAKLAHAARRSIGAGEAAFAAQGVAVGQALVLEDVGEVQADDAGLTQGDEFAALGSAVLRRIAPEFEFGKGGVGGVENAVAV